MKGLYGRLYFPCVYCSEMQSQINDKHVFLILGERLGGGSVIKLFYAYISCNNPVIGWRGTVGCG